MTELKAAGFPRRKPTGSINSIVSFAGSQNSLGKNCINLNGFCVAHRFETSLYY